jgi:Ankyrin repeats (3 copies)
LNGGVGKRKLGKRKLGALNTMEIQRLDATALLTDMTRDVFALLATLLEMKDLARLDMAMMKRRAREALLEALTKQKLCYEGSKGQRDMLSASCLRWLSLRKIAVIGLSVKEDVPSLLAVAVARISPNLRYLHMNYDVDNNTYMEEVEGCCAELEEVKLRNTDARARLSNQDTVMVELVRYDNYDHGYGICCERARLNKRDWHRHPSKGEKFGWRRLMYSRALMRAVNNNDTQVARRLIQSDECNVGAVAFNGYTALWWAGFHINTELARLLLQKDASNIDAQDIDCHKWTALMRVCYNGDAAIIELLIRSGANLDHKDYYNKTAFDILDQYGRGLSQEEKTRLKDLPRLIKQQQQQQQRNLA